MPIKKIFVFVFTIFFTCAFAQSIEFTHLKVQNGLSSNIIYDCIQDSKGLMWFASKNGIERYDGFNVKKYQLGNYTNVNPGYNLYLDRNNTLWVGSQQGLYYYDVSFDKFNRLSEKAIDLSTRVNALLLDYSDKLWIGSITGILQYDITTKSFIELDNNPVGRSIIRTMIQDRDLNIWVGSDMGLFLFNPITNKWHTINQGLESTALFEDNHNRIIVGSQSEGIWVYNQNNFELEIQIPADSKHLSSGTIRSISHWLDGNIMVAVDGGGLNLLDQNFELISRYLVDEDKKASLSDNGVYDIFNDKEDRFWITTHGGGINIYDPHLPPFKLLQHEMNNVNSLNNNFGRAILEASDGKIWFGTEKGVSIFDKEKNKWVHIYNSENRNDFLGSNTVLSLCEDKEGFIWAGTYSGGATKINPKNYKTHTYRNNPSDSNSPGTNSIYSIYRDSKDQIWLGGIRGKLSKYNPSKNNFDQYDINIVYDLIEQNDGIILSGSTNGIHQIDPTSGIVTKVFIPELSNDPTIVCFYKEANNTLFIGTEGSGLIVLSDSYNLVLHLTTKDGLPSNNILGIAKDSSDRYWLSTSNGLSCFDSKSSNIINYGIREGTGNLEYNRRAFLETSDGEIIFGGQNGFTYFTPHEFDDDFDEIPNLIFTDFKLSNRSVVPGTKDSPLTKQIDETDLIRLYHNQNALTFDFTAINFGTSSNNLYQWRLKGLEEEWSPPINRKSISYTNINPGEYTFEVKTSLNGKLWSEIKDISIIITPSFWKSKIAYVSYLILGLGFLGFVINYLRVSIKEKHSEEKIQFFINLAHDLRTPLTLIKAPLHDLKSRENLSPEGTNKINLISKNADRLHQLMTQLLDFQKADLGKFKLLSRKNNIVEYLKDKTLIFKSLAKENHISLTFSSPADTIFVYYDADKMDKIMYNLLTNALKYTPDGGQVDISVASDKVNCIIEIKDTGIGIPKDQQRSIFKRYTRGENAINKQISGSGIGLMLTHQLVKLQKGKIDISSSKDNGTSVKVFLPLGKNHLNADEILEADTNQNIQQPKLTDENILQIKPSGQGKYSILIVEDNWELRNYLVISLSEEYKIYQASNGEEGLLLADSFHPDIIVSDVMMPQLDGIRMCQLLKEKLETSHIPIILLTSLIEVQFKLKGLKVGADLYLEKPFEIRVLKAYLQRIITTRNTLRKRILSDDKVVRPADFSNPVDHELMQSIKAVVYNHLDDDTFSVEVLCREMALSRPVLFRKIKALTGQNIQNFIKIIRLQEAKKLLLKNDHNITEVAYKTGFSNPKYFSVSFKKHFGVTPSKILKNQ